MPKSRAYLLVALALGLCFGVGAIGYAVLVSPTPGIEPPPRVALAPAEVGSQTVSVSVVSVDRVDSLSRFSATLASDNHTFATLDPITHAASGVFAFSDADRDGRFSAGDRIVTSFVTPGHFAILVYWRAALVANVTWDVRPPVVVFAAVGGPGASWVNVTSIDTPHPVGDFSVEMYLNGSWWDGQVPVGPGPSRSGHFSFEDRDADGRLTVGDGFVLNTDPGNYMFIMAWNGAYLTEVSWSV